ncbi:MAG: hypothetical protein GY899_02280 [Verrucomicrobiaceae bacterium]|nr:hypothetical protein [Verrucomicrobiaceae bacterium]
MYLSFLAMLGLSAGLAGPDHSISDTKEPGKHLLLIQPRNLSAGVFVLLPGARETTYTAAYQGTIGLRNYQRDEFRKEFPGGWKQFLAKGKKAASDHLKTLKPKYQRNSKKVIEYALLESDHPLTATTVIVDEFRDLFKETLGDQLLIVIPDRFTVYVFPKLASTIGEHQRKFMQLFGDAVYPASSEIFELTGKGLRAFGSFKED